MQRRLGERVDAASAKDLLARVQELSIANQRLAAELARAEADHDSLQDDLAEAQDDLAAIRAALRNTMRDQNHDST
ncbi:hypothetical protein LUX01_09805 [Streptomyces sudanensis]|uniref:hypothetical protein n=1 Tax=Streptomyces sudanensis TaxID=436397 RepID=UPI0020CBEB98|nr:hypothetical protein [Streptomyces sudanensis]MCP9986951.1 hypothetical protein [Streptomyces sudanensis]